MYEQTGTPKFSCIFYIQGTIIGNQFKIDTYYPNDSSNLIKGYFQIINHKTIGIKLNEDHGGCWNVQHFADEELKFSLKKQIAWTQIRFITTEKANFYSDKSIDKETTILLG